MSLIEWREADRQLHLSNGHLSQVLGIHDGGALGLLHLGRPLAPDRSYRHLTGPPFTGFSNRLAEPIALECPTPASGDYRIPGLVVEQPDGSTVLELAYAGHRITPGKPALDGLPATYVESTPAPGSSPPCRTRSSGTCPSSPGASASATTAPLR